jgi:hypothetical protein
VSKNKYGFRSTFFCRTAESKTTILKRVGNSTTLAGYRCELEHDIPGSGSPTLNISEK